MRGQLCDLLNLARPVLKVSAQLLLCCDLVVMETFSWQKSTATKSRPQADDEMASYRGQRSEWTTASLRLTLSLLLQIWWRGRATDTG